MYGRGNCLPLTPLWRSEGELAKFFCLDIDLPRVKACLRRWSLRSLVVGFHTYFHWKLPVLAAHELSLSPPNLQLAGAWLSLSVFLSKLFVMMPTRDHCWVLQFGCTLTLLSGKEPSALFPLVFPEFHLSLAVYAATMSTSHRMICSEVDKHSPMTPFVQYARYLTVCSAYVAVSHFMPNRKQRGEREDSGESGDRFLRSPFSSLSPLVLSCHM